MDTVTKEVRSRIMAAVGQKNTGPETVLRSALHRLGLRYRLHDRRLPGSPDLVCPKYNAVIFVHGCYWHSHGCSRSTIPKSRSEFWKEKFDANRRRDIAAVGALQAKGWRVLVVWECALKGKTAQSAVSVARAVIDWLKLSAIFGQIEGAEEKAHGSDG